jgi:Kef-type K+ transport system membrane component KefB
MARSEETPKARRDRELGELLQELRVAITGVQVLFAFLLTVPFTQRYESIDASQRRVYFAAVLAAAVSSLLLIAPAANHRLLFREGVKEAMLRAANRVAIAGFVMLALGIGLALYLVTTMVYTTDVAIAVSIGVGLLTAFAWFVFPRLLKEDEERD